jgi:hypothetical protein
MPLFPRYQVAPASVCGRWGGEQRRSRRRYDPWDERDQRVRILWRELPAGSILHIEFLTIYSHQQGRSDWHAENRHQAWRWRERGPAHHGPYTAADAHVGPDL